MCVTALFTNEYFLNALFQHKPRLSRCWSPQTRLGPEPNASAAGM